MKYAKTHIDAVTPKKAKAGDAGWDLTAISEKFVYDVPVPYLEYQFGIALEIPQGFVGLIFPRSSVSNTDLLLSNSVGVIDSGYRGPISARFKVIGEVSQDIKTYKAGDRVCQLVIVPYLEGELTEVSYDDLSKTDRGVGSFGSSGA